MKIGILAVQGDFAAHAAMLDGLGIDSVEVRTPADLEGCDGLILPGGESTTQLQFLQEEGLAETIKRFAANGHAVFGTCAGAILMATDVQNPKQDSLGLLDMTVLRNGYGRQIVSDVFFAKSTLKDDPLEMVFIRGPIIERTGPGIEILAKHAGKPAIVRKGKILATTFHPELTSDTTVHEYFLTLAVLSAHAPSTWQSSSAPADSTTPATRANSGVPRAAVAREDFGNGHAKSATPGTFKKRITGKQKLPAVESSK